MSGGQFDDPADVDTDFIAGKARKQRGSLVSVDVPRVLKLVQEARNGVVGRSGFQSGPAWLSHVDSHAT